MKDPRDIFKLPLAERIQLVQDLWDSIADETADRPLTEEQQKEIARRIAEHDADPASALAWSEVRERLWSSVAEPPADYRVDTKTRIEMVLERSHSWPAEDQQELIEAARDIEARRTGVYVLSDEENAAIDKALKSPLIPEEEVLAFWKARGIS
ncbi:MAG: addiction module protein [Alphaproteobacteria bacterium]|nr:addiction module protein [Alphaproteobacteria bacterium]MBL6936260.1 addiction module protein [Alphaproteobacteria bacterium]MBL7098689.1 addiction module protein [Alphaproteobacteria bacterium]